MHSANVRQDAPVQLREQDRAAVGTGPAQTLPAQAFLQPIAPPSVLGLFGLAGATFIVGAHLAGWYGSATTPEYLFPFAALFGGLAQFLAGMWAYKARDGLATAIHGMWGSFFLAYGLLSLLFALGTLTPPTPSGLFVELGYWFIVLAVTTWIGTWIASGRSGALAGVLAFLAAGSTAMAIACLVGSSAWAALGGWLFVAAAALAWYTGTAFLAKDSFGRVVLPLFKSARARQLPAYSVGIGEPGVRHGQ